MDAFWEYPFYFAKIVHDNRDEMVDIFAGRLWDRQPNAALVKLRGLLKRERCYHGKLTEPLGSRYHPERAEIWVEEAVV